MSVHVSKLADWLRLKFSSVNADMGGLPQPPFAKDPWMRCERKLCQGEAVMWRSAVRALEMYINSLHELRKCFFFPILFQKSSETRFPLTLPVRKNLFKILELTCAQEKRVDLLSASAASCAAPVKPFDGNPSNRNSRIELEKPTGGALTAKLEMNRDTPSSSSSSFSPSFLVVKAAAIS